MPKIINTDSDLTDEEAKHIHSGAYGSRVRVVAVILDSPENGKTRLPFAYNPDFWESFHFHGMDYHQATEVAFTDPRK